MSDKKELSLFEKFMVIHYTLPFGNGGRGTKVFLWPFVGVAVMTIAMPLIDRFLIG